MPRTKKPRLNRKKRDSIQRTRWILDDPSTARQQRGLVAEELALYGLAYHKKKKTKFLKGRRIIEITSTMHFSADDLADIDAFVKLQAKDQSESEVLAMQFQNWGNSDTEEEYKKKDICLVIVRPQEEKLEAREKVFTAISSFLLQKEEAKALLVKPPSLIRRILSQLGKLLNR